MQARPARELSPAPWGWALLGSLAAPLLLTLGFLHTSPALALLGLTLGLLVLAAQPTQQALGLGVVQGWALGAGLFGGLFGAARETLGWSPLLSVAFAALVALWFGLGQALASPLLARLLASPRACAPLAGVLLLLGVDRWPRLASGGMALAEVESLAPTSLGALGGLTLLGLAYGLALALRRPTRARAGSLLGLCLVLVLVTAPPTRAPSQRASVLLVPGSVPRALHGSRADAEVVLSHYLAESRRALAQSAAPIDLVVWPEGAAALDLVEAPALRRRLARGLRLGPHRPYLLLGAVRWRGEALHNAAVLLDPEGAVVGTYLRRALLPWGEVTPAWSPVRRRNLTRDFTPGPEAQAPLVLTTRAGARLRLRVRICGEGLRPDRYRGPAPDLDLVIASDGVFPAGSRIPRLVEAATAARTRATGVPLLRVAHQGGAAWAIAGRRRHARGALVFQLGSSRAQPSGSPRQVARAAGRDDPS